MRRVVPGRALVLLGIGSVVASTLHLALPLAAVQRSGPVHALMSALGGQSVVSTAEASSLPEPVTVPKVDYVTPSTGWAVGYYEDTSGVYHARIEVTNDGGASWTSESAPAPATSLDGVDFVDTAHGWVVGQGGGAPVLLRTVDGVTWTSSRLPAPGAANAVSFVDSQHGWIVGSQWVSSTSSYTGWVLTTSDGGLTWSSQTVPSGTPLLDGVKFVSATVGWAVGYQQNLSGTLVPFAMRTSDGGVNWIHATLPSGYTSGRLYAISAVDTSHVWAIDDGPTTGTNPVYASTDGGVTWTAQTMPACLVPSSTGTAQILGIAFTDTTHGVIAGQGPCGARGATAAVIAGTSDGGTTWGVKYTSSTDGEYESVSFADALHGLAVSNSYTSISSIDGGSSWTGSPVPIPGPPLTGPSNSELWGASNPGETGGGFQLEGDGVNPINGNLVQAAPDLVLPGRGRPLAFSRTYNSLDAAGESAGLTDPLGYGWTDSYNIWLEIDTSSTYFTVHQENGSTVPFQASGNGFTAPARVNATLAANASGYLYTLADQRSDQFDSAGKLVSETDRDGYVTSIARDASSGQITQVSDATGQVLTFTYTPTGQVQTVGDAYGRTVRYAYDGSLNLYQVTDADGGIMTYGYDADHRLTTVQDAAGRMAVTATAYASDGSSRVTSQSDGLSRPTTFAYAAGSTTVTHPAGDQTVYQQGSGEPTQVTRGANTPLAATWQFGYDVDDNRTVIVDPRGYTSAQTFDSKGNLLTSTDPLNRKTTYTYTSLNDIASVQDPAGDQTTYSYNDSHHNLTQISRLLTSTNQTASVTLAYDPNQPGDVLSRTDQDGNVWHYTWDAHGDPASTTDPLGNKVTTSYDGRGFLMQQVSPLGNVAGGNPAAYTTQYGYDNLGDRTSVTDPLGHQSITTYDAARNVSQVQDATGHITQYGYDAATELIQITRPDTTILQNAYDSDGRLWKQYDASNALTQYDHDALGRPSVVTDPLTRTTHYAYDADSNVTQVTDASSRTTTFGYDAADELSSITYSDGVTPNVSFTYDAAGRRHTMADGTGTSTYTYDSLDRLTQLANGAGTAVSYGYDLRGHVTSLTYPGGNTVTRQYDAAGQLQWVKDWVLHQSNFGYDADGNLTSIANPNGLTTSITYDAADRLMGMSTKTSGGSTVASLTYGRDADNLLTSSQSTGIPGGAETYGYTGLNQVGTLNGQAFSYDAAADVTQIVGATTRTLSYGSANQLKTLTQGSSVTNYGFNAEGQRVSATTGGSTTSLGYDQAGRLTSYAGTTTYAYNGDGLRMSKTTGHTRVPFTWDAAEGNPTLLYDGTTSYVYGPNGWPLEQISGTKSVTYYYHPDQLGSTRALSDSTGALVNTYAYDPYGKVTGSTGTVSNPLQFSGEYTDSESGFTYLRARYYDPQSGQFLARDGLVNGHTSPYAYANDTPLNATDPSGLSALDTANGYCDAFLIHICHSIEHFFGTDVSSSKDYRDAYDFGGDLNDVMALAFGTDDAIADASAIDRAVVGATDDTLAGDAATEGAAAADASATIEVNGTRFIYGNRVLARAAEEPGLYHNFPSIFDRTILNGNREVLDEGYVRCTVPGRINGVKGVYEIGTRPTAIGGGELITHRFFNPW